MTLTEEIRVADAAGVRQGWRGWAALAVLMLPVLLVSVDNTVLSFALPEIARDLTPTSAQQLWIIDVYPLVLAGLLVTMGSLGDRFGRRRLLMIGATGFAGISAVAAFAPSAELLIAARAAMGFFGAMLMPSTMSLLQAGVDTTVIALWLGHADVRSTQPYLHADLTIKEKALALVTPPTVTPGRYKPPDALLAFLEEL